VARGRAQDGAVRETMAPETLSPEAMS